jgi:predicted NBD/HSP70 family sugar kinase
LTTTSADPPNIGPHQLTAALNLGKTKLSIGVFNDDLMELETYLIQSSVPPESLPSMLQNLRQIFRRYEIDSVELSVFGPLVTDRTQPDFGAIVQF